MKALTAVDQIFLTLEKAHQPTHVGGIQIFSLPKDSPKDYVLTIYDELIKTNEAKGLFARKLNYRFGLPHWIEDKEFNVENHLFYHQLPNGANFLHLITLTEKQHCLMLDRTVPLWQCHVIEGFAENQFAIYLKVHHALLDGVSAMNMMNELFATEAGEIPPAFWNRELKRLKKQEKAGLFKRVKNLANDTSKQLKSISEIAADTRKQLTGQSQFDDFFAAPKTLFNHNISASRKFVTETIETKRIKHLAKHFGCSSNDIILSLCGTALRNYLQIKDQLPHQPLIASVPASLRTDKSIGGNEIGMLHVNLGTELESIVSRTRVVIDSARYEKARLSDLSKEAATNISIIANFPNLVQGLLGVEMKSLPFNLIISHVVAPKGKKYLGEATLAATYPMSVLMDGMGLNITLVTDTDQIHFGLIACERSVKQLDVLSQGLLTALNELEKAVGATQHPPVTESIAQAS